MYNQLVISRENNSPGKKDASGAFEPESKAMTRILRDMGRNVTHIRVRTDSYENKHTMRGWLLDKINRTHKENGNPLSAVSIFCHGWRTGVELLPTREQGAKEVAQVLAARGVKYFNLFACSTGEPNPNGNWAQWVVEECVQLGHKMLVFSHEPAGHTTWNPNINLYWSDGEKLHQQDHRDFVTKRKGFVKKMKRDQEFRLMLPFALDEV